MCSRIHWLAIVVMRVVFLLPSLAVRPRPRSPLSLLSRVGLFVLFCLFVCLFVFSDPLRLCAASSRRETRETQQKLSRAERQRRRSRRRGELSSRAEPNRRSHVHIGDNEREVTSDQHRSEEYSTRPAAERSRPSGEVGGEQQGAAATTSASPPFTTSTRGPTPSHLCNATVVTTRQPVTSSSVSSQRRRSHIEYSS